MQLCWRKTTALPLRLCYRLSLDCIDASVACLPQHKGKLAAELSGPSGEVFAKALRGLSGARLTRPGQFCSADDAPAVRCSYKVRL